MARHVLRAALAAIFVVAAVCGAGAQCAFEHPKKAREFEASLVQAFNGCGDYCGGECSPDTETEGGVPACGPPETFNELVGYPPNGWRWDAAKGQGRVQLKALSAGPVDPLNPPGDTTDLAVLLKMKGVVDDGYPFTQATGDGSLEMIVRMTLDDRDGGDMTTFDFVLNFPFTMMDGKVTLKTTFDAALNLINQAGLPRCSNVEVVWISVIDPNGTAFAREGLFLQ
jgi:hypothetical protein